MVIPAKPRKDAIGISRSCRKWLVGWSFAFCLVSQNLSADTLLLKNGGRVEGTIRKRPSEDANPKDTGTKTAPAKDSAYIVELKKGAYLRIAASDVGRVLETTEIEADYERRLMGMQDTAEGHEALAKWCQEHGLVEQKQFHWQEVLRLDPDHAEARRLAGYQRIGGEWIRQDQFMQRQGFVRYRGSWRLPQEVAALERQEAEEVQVGNWRRNIQMWLGWLGGRRDAEALEKLRTIKDPLAAPGLIDALAKESRPDVRSFLLERLAQLDSPAVAPALVDGALGDGDEEYRLACVRHLKERGAIGASSAFVSALQSSDNRTINRAAVALGQLGDKRAILPLIFALVTEHSTLVKPTAEIRPSFGSGNGGGLGGLSVGSKPTKVTKRLENKSVLEALVKLTEQNFRYSEADWRQWYIQQEALGEDVNLRRDP